ncbi:hypothetical protein DFH09DRAFT_1090078 [Mycena vulgaris]|nr:hypothetical protein DFH09DRAFT_1090078 [Mycena vulgaris]
MKSGGTTRTAQTIIHAGGVDPLPSPPICGALWHAELPEPPPIVLGLCASRSALGALGLVRPSKCERGCVRGRLMWRMKTSAALAAIRSGSAQRIETAPERAFGRRTSPRRLGVLSRAVRQAHPPILALGWARRRRLILLTNSHVGGVIVRMTLLICFGRVYACGRIDERKPAVIFHDGLDEANPGRRTHVAGRKDCVHKGHWLSPCWGTCTSAVASTAIHAGRGQRRQGAGTRCSAAQSSCSVTGPQILTPAVRGGNGSGGRGERQVRRRRRCGRICRQYLVPWLHHASERSLTLETAVYFLGWRDRRWTDPWTAELQVVGQWEWARMNLRERRQARAFPEGPRLTQGNGG